MNLFFNFKKAISAFAIVAFFTIIPTEFTWAHHTNNWGYVSMGTNDYVYNYDFDSKSLSIATTMATVQEKTSLDGPKQRQIKSAWQL